MSNRINKRQCYFPFPQIVSRGFTDNFIFVIIENIVLNLKCEAYIITCFLKKLSDIFITACNKTPETAVAAPPKMAMRMRGNRRS